MAVTCRECVEDGGLCERMGGAEGAIVCMKQMDECAKGRMEEFEVCEYLSLKINALSKTWR